MNFKKTLCLAAAVAAFGAFLAPAHAGKTIDAIKQRGEPQPAGLCCC